MKKATLEKKLFELLPQAAPVPMLAPRPAACGCDGSGLVPVAGAHGERVMQECPCRATRRTERQLERARIPERYRAKTLDTFDATTPALARGLSQARRYVAEYPVGTAGRGLLFVGPVGVGKTHLAVSVLRDLMLRGARGLFWDVRELFNAIKQTFNDRSLSESGLLEPVYAAEVLVLDELGAAQATEWSYDAVERIINARYNANLATIVTTNLPNRAPGASEPSSTDYGRAVAAVRGETLGDRIGARMHSRLQEMCQAVEMTGEDYRKKGWRT